MTLRSASLALIFLSVGCAAPSFVGQTGRVTPDGAFRAGVGSGYNVNTSALQVVEDARDLAGRLQAQDCPTGSDPGRRCWTRADIEPIVDAAFRFALVAPLASHNEVSARYGVLDGFDAGIHLGADSWRIDGGWQVFGPADPKRGGTAGSVFVSYGKRSLGMLGDVIEDIMQGEAKLTDVEIAFVSGTQWREIAHAYAGARYGYTMWKLQVIPDLPIVYEADGVQQELLGTDSSGGLSQAGAVLGGALGYRHVFLGAELNVMRTFGKARVLFEERDLSGWALMPAVYLYGQY